MSDIHSIIGIDEVGCGAIAGPLVAGGVILNEHMYVKGLKDSKAISEKNRERICADIKEKALFYTIVEISAKKIDKINIFNARMLAVNTIAKKMSHIFTKILIDGKHIPKWKYLSRAIISGDNIIPCISAAAILAKVYRDKKMSEYDKITKCDYKFSQHKGYPTKLHLQMLNKYGATTIHRKSFNPVKKIITIHKEIDPIS